MLTVKPYFYDNFHCKADKCSDSCCIGWEVDIDDASLEKYNSVTGEFGNKLKKNIVCDDHSHFKLLKDDVCPFLNCDGLCDIYINLGKDALCEICSEHPRFYEWLDGRTEKGLGLCCEKVCEMLFENDRQFELIYDDDGESCVTDEFQNELLKKRDICFDIIRDRNRSLRNRIRDLLDFCDMLECEYFAENKISEPYHDKNTILKNVIELMSQTEPINDKWTKYINEMMSDFDNYKNAQSHSQFCDNSYEQLLLYMIYRYFMKSLTVGSVAVIARFCVINLIFVYSQDLFTVYKTGDFTYSDRIDNVKRWSKQIEYDEQNIELIMQNSSNILQKVDCLL